MLVTAAKSVTAVTAVCSNVTATNIMRLVACATARKVNIAVRVVLHTIPVLNTSAPQTQLQHSQSQLKQPAAFNFSQKLLHDLPEHVIHVEQVVCDCCGCVIDLIHCFSHLVTPCCIGAEILLLQCRLGSSGGPWQKRRSAGQVLVSHSPLP